MGSKDINITMGSNIDIAMVYIDLWGVKLYLYIYIHIYYFAYKYLGSLSWGYPCRRLDHFFSDSARGAHHTHLGRCPIRFDVVDPVQCDGNDGHIVGISSEYHRNRQYTTNMIRIRHIIGNMYWKD